METKHFEPPAHNHDYDCPICEKMSQCPHTELRVELIPRAENIAGNIDTRDEIILVCTECDAWTNDI